MKTVVQYQHFRYNRHGRLKRYVRSNPGFRPLPNGGVTVCSVLENGMVGTGVAVCQPEDAFCYRYGRVIALSNAKKDIARAIRAKAPK